MGTRQRLPGKLKKFNEDIDFFSKKKLKEEKKDRESNEN